MRFQSWEHSVSNFVNLLASFFLVLLFCVTLEIEPRVQKFWRRILSLTHRHSLLFPILVQDGVSQATKLTRIPLSQYVPQRVPM